MSIARTAPYGTVTDGSTPTTGTIGDNVWVQGLIDLLDSRWSRTTTSSTGTQTVINPSDADILLCNNASDLTIRSFTAPTSLLSGTVVPRRKLLVVSIGAGNVFLNHQDTTGTTAANRIVNAATTAATALSAGNGVALYWYDDNASRWRLATHEQGAPIAFTPTLKLGGGSTGMTFSAQFASYFLRGRQVYISGRFTLTAKGSSTGMATIESLPYSVNSSYYGAVAVPYYNTLASLTSPVSGYISPTSTVVTLQQGGAASTANLTEANFANTSDLIFNGHYLTQ